MKSKNRSKRENYCYEYHTPKNTYIKTKFLKKSLKGHYKNDIINLKIKSINGVWDLLLTPKEAVVIATGLGVVVIESEYVHRRLRG